MKQKVTNQFYLKNYIQETQRYLSLKQQTETKVETSPTAADKTTTKTNDDISPNEILNNVLTNNIKFKPIQECDSLNELNLMDNIGKKDDNGIIENYEELYSATCKKSQNLKSEFFLKKVHSRTHSIDGSLDIPKSKDLLLSYEYIEKIPNSKIKHKIEDNIIETKNSSKITKSFYDQIIKTVNFKKDLKRIKSPADMLQDYNDFLRYNIPTNVKSASERNHHKKKNRSHFPTNKDHDGLLHERITPVVMHDTIRDKNKHVYIKELKRGNTIVKSYYNAPRSRLTVDKIFYIKKIKNNSFESNISEKKLTKSGSRELINHDSNNKNHQKQTLLNNASPIDTVEVEILKNELNNLRLEVNRLHNNFDTKLKDNKIIDENPIIDIKNEKNKASIINNKDSKIIVPKMEINNDKINFIDTQFSYLQNNNYLNEVLRDSTETPKKAFKEYRKYFSTPLETEIKPKTEATPEKDNLNIKNLIDKSSLPMSVPNDLANPTIDQFKKNSDPLKYNVTLSSSDFLNFANSNIDNLKLETSYLNTNNDKTSNLNIQIPENGSITSLDTNKQLYYQLKQLLESTTNESELNSDISSQVDALLANPKIKTQLKQLHSYLLHNPNLYVPQLENVVLSPTALAMQKKEFKTLQNKSFSENFKRSTDSQTKFKTNSTQ